MRFVRRVVSFRSLLACIPLLSLACGAAKPATVDEAVSVADTAGTLNESSPAPKETSESPAAVTAGSDIQLLESVIRQNTAARENVHSLYAEFTYHEECVAPEVPVPGGVVPGGRQTNDGASKLWIKGDNYHQEYTRHRVWLDAGHTQDERYINVMGDTYFVDFLEAMKVLMVYRFDNRNSLYAPVKDRTVPPMNILNFGYSLIYSPLEEHYNASMTKHPGHFLWAIERETVEARQCFRLKQKADIQGKQFLWAEVLVEADRGFLISEYRHYAADGTIEISMDCDLQEIQEGVWFPMKVKRYHFDWESTLQIEVKEAKVNCDIDDAMFTVERMAFDPVDVRMYEYAPGGREREVKAYWNNQWVPIKMIPRDMRPRRQDSREPEQLGLPILKDKPDDVSR